MSKKRDKEEQEFRFGLLIFIVYVVISVIAGVSLGWWFTGGNTCHNDAINVC